MFHSFEVVIIALLKTSTNTLTPLNTLTFDLSENAEGRQMIYIYSFVNYVESHKMHDAHTETNKFHTNTHLAYI